MKAAPDRSAKSAARKASRKAVSSKDVIIQTPANCGQIRLQCNNGDAATLRSTDPAHAGRGAPKLRPAVPGGSIDGAALNDLTHSFLKMVKTRDVAESFEAALAELEAIVAKMEGGQLPLKESLAAYQRGAELLRYCQEALKDAQLQIEVLETGVLKAFAEADAEGTGSDES